MILSGAGTSRILDPVKALLLCALLSASVFAATPAIGIVTASGHFTLQGSEVWGNATLFEGATIETTSASSQLALRNGVKVQLAAGSRAHVFADRLTLDRGVGQVASAAPFEIDAAALRIQGAGLRVGMGETVEVAALTGVAKVSGKGDLLLATIPSGRSMSFAPQAAQTGAVKRDGCLLYKDNHFILQDDNTQEVVELNGQDLAPNLGNRVEITGTASTAKPAVSIAASVHERFRGCSACHRAVAWWLPHRSMPEPKCRKAAALHQPRRKRLPRPAECPPGPRRRSGSR